MQASRRVHSTYGLVFALTITATALSCPVARAQERTLFSFLAPQGAKPGALVRGRDGRLYGIAREGGAHGHGVVFAIGAESTRQVLYAFRGQADGSNPSALVQGADDALYGLVSLPSAGEAGLRIGVFRLTYAGAFESVAEMSGTTEAAILVRGEDGRIYGSSAGSGQIFALGAGRALEVLHRFAGGTWANTLAVTRGGRIYGTTPATGESASQLFRLTRGGRFSVLASFEAGEDHVAPVPTALALGSSALYVGTRHDTRGALYRLTAQDKLELLGSLDAAPTQLVAAESQLYGITVTGGEAGQGSVLRVTESGELVTLYSFRGERDGSQPSALSWDGTSVYGSANGGAGGEGTLFRLDAQQQFQTLHDFSYPDGAAPSALVRAPDGALYGTTQVGGPNASGTVFKADASGELQTLHAFSGRDGSAPGSLSYGRDGNLYGRTQAGGANGFGTVFRISTDGELTTLVQLSEQGQGRGPALIQRADGTLYGADQAGSGHVFRVTPSGQLENVYSFPGLSSRDGATPSALIEGADGALYGTTLGAYGPLIPPSFSSGTIFRIGQDGSFSTLYAFSDDANALGAAPRSLVWGADGQLYGTTSNLAFLCGVFGGLFRLTPATREIELLYSFTGKEDGTGPMTLLQRGDDFFGLTAGGVGPGSDAANACQLRNSTLFRYSAAGLTTLAELSFAISTGVNSAELGRAAALVDGQDGKLYGVTAAGGAASAGALFVYDRAASAEPE